MVWNHFPHGSNTPSQFPSIFYPFSLNFFPFLPFLLMNGCSFSIKSTSNFNLFSNFPFLPIPLKMNISFHPSLPSFSFMQLFHPKGSNRREYDLLTFINAIKSGNLVIDWLIKLLPFDNRMIWCLSSHCPLLVITQSQLNRVGIPPGHSARASRELPNAGNSENGQPPDLSWSSLSPCNFLINSATYISSHLWTAHSRVIFAAQGLPRFLANLNLISALQWPRVVAEGRLSPVFPIPAPEMEKAYLLTQIKNILFLNFSGVSETYFHMLS